MAFLYQNAGEANKFTAYTTYLSTTDFVKTNTGIAFNACSSEPVTLDIPSLPSVWVKFDYYRGPKGYAWVQAFVNGNQDLGLHGTDDDGIYRFYGTSYAGNAKGSIDTVKLHFDAANDTAELWINGTLACKKEAAGLGGKITKLTLSPSGWEASNFADKTDNWMSNITVSDSEIADDALVKYSPVQDDSKDIGIVFNGTDNYIQCPEAADRANKFIFDITFSTTDTRGGKGYNGDFPALIGNWSGRDGTFTLGYNNGNLALLAKIDNRKYFDSGKKVNDGKKHNVKFLSDGSKLYLYLDNEAIDTGIEVTGSIDEYWSGEYRLRIGYGWGNDACASFVFYELKVYDNDTENDKNLQLWYKPKADAEGVYKTVVDRSSKKKHGSICGKTYTYIENGIEKNPYTFPYANKGYGDTCYDSDKTVSSTGVGTTGLKYPVPDGIDELWIRFDLRLISWVCDFGVDSYDKNDKNLISDYYWFSNTSHTLTIVDSDGNDEKYQTRKRWGFGDNKIHSCVLHYKVGMESSLAELFIDSMGEPFRRIVGKTRANEFGYINLWCGSKGRFSDIVISASELSIDDHCTDAFDASRVTTTAVALRTLGYTSEQEIPTSRRITYQYETKDTYSTMRRLSAAVTDQFATEREVWSPYVYIRDAIDAVRVIQRSFGFNVRTERNTLKDAKNDRASKKHVTLENLRMFLSCCDERFVQQKPGFGLSSNDFTDKYKERIRSIDEDAEKNTVIGISVDDLDLDIPKSRVINLGAITEDDILSLANEVFGKI